MKTLVVALFFALSVAGAALAQTAPTVYAPDSVKWTAGTGPFSGAQVAVVYGNPDKHGQYIIRLKMPAGFKIGPHYHGDDENVTVLEGTLALGLGDKFDESKMSEASAGTFISIPKGLHHYAMAKADSIVEISAMGPRSMNMLKQK